MAIQNTKGFTLVETIIYTALIGLFMTGLVSLSLSLFGLHAKVLSAEEVLAGARSIDRVLKYYIENRAVSEVYPVGVFASSSLEIILDDASKFKIFTENDNLYFKMGTSEKNKINSSEIKVTNLEIQNFSGNINNPILSVSCNISFFTAGDHDYTYDYQFNGSYRIRNEI